MGKIELTNTDLFLDLTTVKYGESFFDLHNDYDCEGINYKLLNKTISFLFQPRIPEQAKKELCLLFEEATIADFKVNLKHTADRRTVDLFYRGRYEMGGNLFEISPNGEGIFYIDFWEGDSFVIFSKKVTLIV
jgi:hypothetical protein